MDIGNNTEKIVSIIIPFYQAEDTLRECVLSCVTQKNIDDDNFEIILVDDGSKDGSPKIADELAAEYGQDKIKVKHIKNRGVSGARNIGLEMAKGKYICFVDSDDTISENCTGNMLKYADNDIVLIDGSDYNNTPQSLSGYQYIENHILESNTHVWGKLFLREMLSEKHIHFKEGLTIGEDLLFLLDVAIAEDRERGIKVVPVDSGDYRYTDNENGAMKSAFKASYIDELTCWKLAEEKLSEVRENLSAYAFVKLAVSQILTALLVIGKVAVIPEGDKDNDLAREAVFSAGDRIKHALKTKGAFAGLSFGHKVKVLLFNISPTLYLNQYAKYKDR
ncbi:MAG: glycosyltransferase family 2 protein [Butyrivibrio sp.]|nr:glycosyltransferase family 2 protein [Butyrivibrio sp.]